jgi:hypothetical protein
MEELQQQVYILKAEVEDIRALLWKKVGGGSADIKGNMVQLSTVNATIATDSITQAMIGANAVGQSEWKYEQVSVTVNAGSASGTGTVTSGSTIIGWRATGNQDQLIDNMAVSGTTLTITLAANATANNTFSVTLLKT